MSSETTQSGMESTNEHGEPLAGEIEDGRQPTIEEIDMMDADNDTRSVPGSYAESNLSVEGSGAGTPSVKRRRGGSQVSETSAILREFLAERPKPSDFMQQKPIDDLQHFFDSMASTVRKFSLMRIARIKLKISQIVGEEEMTWAEEQARTQIIFVNDVEDQSHVNME